MCIPNTMKTKKIAAETLLEGTGISVLDAARLIRNITDMLPRSDIKITALQYCRRVIECGQKHYRNADSEMSVSEGFKLYLETKRDLREAYFCDIKYIGNRILKACPDFAKRNFSEISLADCEKLLSSTFSTPSQFNKGRSILHGIFAFAARHEWCERNPVRLVSKKRVAESEIRPLSLAQSKRILNTAKSPQNRNYAAAIGILLWVGLRSTEVRRLKWRDIDLSEKTITVRSQCSKTGGVRQVEICSALKKWLGKYRSDEGRDLCPPDWIAKWRKIRNESGFKNCWIPDILRHTYASFHAKCFRDLPRLQLNMGHRDITLLRSRYVNMRNISKSEAITYFSNMKPN